MRYVISAIYLFCSPSLVLIRPKARTQMVFHTRIVQCIFVAGILLGLVIQIPSKIFVSNIFFLISGRWIRGIMILVFCFNHYVFQEFSNSVFAQTKHHVARLQKEVSSYYLNAESI